MKLSFGITVCNEYNELNNLLDRIYPFILKNNDEIVIVYDKHKVTDEVLKLLKNAMKSLYNVSIYPFDFQNNFSDYKNYLNSRCSGDYIFQLDADEIIEESLLESIKEILEMNSVDLIQVPRYNIVNDITPEHIAKWNWRIDANGAINWPDLQGRIYKNSPGIKWAGKVHEVIIGYTNVAVLPLEIDYCIYHIKSINKQEAQNNLYSKI